MFEAISQITTKDLILLGIGSGITLTLFLFRILKEYIQNYKSVTPLLGKWYSYHFSRVNYRPVFRSEIWDIRRGVFSLQINTSDEDRPDLKYKGQVMFDGAYIVLEFKGNGHKEIIQYRLTHPIPNEDTLMLGFHLSKDFDQEMYTSCKLVSRNERSVEDAKDILQQSFEWIGDECSIRRSRNPIAAKNISV